MIIINIVYGSTVYILVLPTKKMGDWFANTDSLKEGKNKHIHIYIYTYLTTTLGDLVVEYEICSK